MWWLIIIIILAVLTVLIVFHGVSYFHSLYLLSTKAKKNVIKSLGQQAIYLLDDLIARINYQKNNKLDLNLVELKILDQELQELKMIVDQLTIAGFSNNNQDIPQKEARFKLSAFMEQVKYRWDINYPHRNIKLDIISNVDWFIGDRLNWLRYLEYLVAVSLIVLKIKKINLKLTFHQYPLPHENRMRLELSLPNAKNNHSYWYTPHHQNRNINRIQQILINLKFDQFEILEFDDKNNILILDWPFQPCPQMEKVNSLKEMVSGQNNKGDEWSILGKILTLWIIEDNKINQKIHEKIFKKLGFENIIIFNSGSQACDYWGEDEIYPDIIIVDLFMPGLSGAELTDWIRKQQHPNNDYYHPLIIACSADSVTYNQDYLYEIGFDKIIDKPLTYQKGINVLQQLLPTWSELENLPVDWSKIRDVYLLTGEIEQLTDIVYYYDQQLEQILNSLENNKELKPEKIESLVKSLIEFGLIAETEISPEQDLVKLLQQSKISTYTIVKTMKK